MPDTIRHKKLCKLDVLEHERTKELKKPTSPPSISFHPRVSYQTDTVYTDPEKQLLEKGLQHAIAPLNPSHAANNLIADLTEGFSAEM